MLDKVVLLLNKVCVSLPDDIGTMLVLVDEVVTMPLVLLVSDDILSLMLVKTMVDE